jgi:fatty-acyl-CoA synthase
MLRGDGSAHWLAEPSATCALRDDLTTGGLLDEAATRWPDQLALVYAAYATEGGNLRWTFAELRARSREVAAALIASGIERGERIAVWATNVPEWLLLQFGSAYAGVIVVPLNPLYRTDEVVDIVGRSGAVAIFVEAEVRGGSLLAVANDVASRCPDVRALIAIGPRSEHLQQSWAQWLRCAPAGRSAVDARAAAVRPDDVAQIQFTSGTTGAPKGAMLRHGAVVNNARLFANRAEWVESSGLCTCMPLFHCGGSVLSVLGAVATGTTLMPLVTFDPRKAIDTIDAEGATILAAVPTMLLAIEEELARNGGTLHTLTKCGTGGSLVPVDILQRWAASFGVMASITYGLTESSPVISQTAPSEPFELQAATVGRALPYVEIDIADPETGKTLQIGECGEIRTRGWLVMAGYFGDEQATKAAITDDGWLRSGDLGTMDADGYVRVTGRAKDVVIRGGENIYPTEIEAILRGLPAVADAYVVGVPDERYGETCAAFVRLKSGTSLTLAEMREQLDGRVARYKIPSHLRLVDAFPMTPSGKVQKFKLRDDFVSVASVTI